jgi:hypothetical protein
LARRIPVLIYGKDFWQEVLNFPALVRHGMISATDLDLFHVVDDVDQAFDLLTRLLDAQPDGVGVDFARSLTAGQTAGTPHASLDCNPTTAGTNREGEPS